MSSILRIHQPKRIIKEYLTTKSQEFYLLEESKAAPENFYSTRAERRNLVLIETKWHDCPRLVKKMSCHRHFEQVVCSSRRFCRRALAVDLEPLRTSGAVFVLTDGNSNYKGFILILQVITQFRKEKGRRRR